MGKFCYTNIGRRRVPSGNAILGELLLNDPVFLCSPVQWSHGGHFLFYLKTLSLGVWGKLVQAALAMPTQVTSDQNRRFNRTSDFSLFYGLFRAFRCLHRLENVRYFFAKNRFKIGHDHMFDHICHEKAIFHKGFRNFAILILCKMTAVLCF